MISLEQIHTLENRVHSAVARIHALSEENATLKGRLESYEHRIAELETLVSAFKADQEEIEAGIMSALKHLDELENTVTEPTAPAVAPPPATIGGGPTEPITESVGASPESAEAPADAIGEPRANATVAEPDIVSPEELRAEPPDSERPSSGLSDDEPTEANTAPDEDDDEEPELDIF